MYRWCKGAVVIAALSLIGCEMNSQADLSWQEARPLGKELETYHPPIKPQQEQTLTVDDLPIPSGELTLRHAMALALIHSPKMQAYGWDVRQAEALMLQAGVWENPELEVEFENFGGSGDFSGTQSLETTISIAQTIPLSGSIERRKEVAGYEAQLVGWDYEAARLEVLTEVTQRYIKLLAAQRQASVAKDSLTLAEQVLEITNKRIEAGDAPLIETARAGVPVAMARVSLRRAERHATAAGKQLSITWGANTPTFTSVAGNLDTIHQPPSPEQLVMLINQNPQVARWATEISARQAEANLAKAESTPSLTARLGYKYDRGEDANALVAGLSIPLPIFDNRQGDELAARFAAISAKQRQLQAKRRLEVMLSETYTRLFDAYDEASTIRDEAMAPATEAFNVTRRAFERGDLAFIDILDAERTLVELQTQYLDALTDYHTNVAEIEGILGQSLESIAKADEIIIP